MDKREEKAKEMIYKNLVSSPSFFFQHTTSHRDGRSWFKKTTILFFLMNGDVFNYTNIHELELHKTKDRFMLTHENSFYSMKKKLN